jgi:hypothetical protein
MLAPLLEAIRRHTLAGNTLHGDDTPVPALPAAQGGPRRSGCGPMCATNARPGAMRRRRSGLPIAPTARANTRGGTWPTTRASCIPTAMAVSTGCSTPRSA